VPITSDMTHNDLPTTQNQSGGENPFRPAFLSPASTPPQSPGNLGGLLNTPPTKDPGSRGRAAIAWAVVITCFLCIAVLQQLPNFSKPAVPPTTPSAAALEPLASDFDQLDLMGRMMVKFSELSPPNDRAQLYSMVGIPQLPDDQQVRMMPLTQTMLGTEDALKKISALQDKLKAQAKSLNADQANATPDPSAAHKLATSEALQEDLATLARLYSAPSASVSTADRNRIERRFGWLGKVALTFDFPNADPTRAGLVGGGMMLAIGAMVLGFAVISAFIAGCVVLVLLAVNVLNGRLKPAFVRPISGGSLPIETAAVFMVAFLSLKAVIGLIAKFTSLSDEQLMVVSLTLQWTILPLVLIVPMFLGYRPSQIRSALGLHAGKGVLREIGAGVVTFLACIPLYFAAVVLVLIILLIQQLIASSGTGGGAPIEPPANPLTEIIGTGGVVALLLGTLAVIWAPLVEEIIFRGGLFRQLTVKLPIIIAAMLTGLIFALMHGYGLALMPPLIMLGTIYSLVRYWRGSIIACITAHALHNGSVTIILGSLIYALS
jgi:membrane protease YdiL (CAAX protease family)